MTCTPNPYALIGPEQAASLLLDLLARRLGATIPADARDGLEALVRTAIDLAREDVRDARQVLAAVRGILARYPSHWSGADAA